MHRAEIKASTKITDATFNNYLAQGIILVNKNSGAGGRNYAVGSISRINTTRRLTPIGYTIKTAHELISKRSTNEINTKLDSLPVGEFKKWVQDVLKV